MIKDKITKNDGDGNDRGEARVAGEDAVFRVMHVPRCTRYAAHHNILLYYDVPLLILNVFIPGSLIRSRRPSTDCGYAVTGNIKNRILAKSESSVRVVVTEA